MNCGSFLPKVACTLLVTFSFGLTTQAQDDLEVSLAKYKSTPAIFELAKMAHNYDSTVAIAAITSLRQFSKVRTGRISRDALDAYKQLELKAKRWGQEFTNSSAPGTVSIVDAGEVDHQKLVYLHLLQPKAVAFVKIRVFTDYDMRSLHNLASLENLTIQECRLIEGHGLRNIRLPNLKILHLNGSSIENTSGISLKNFPNLKFVNLKDTNLTKKQVSSLKRKLGDQVTIKF